MNINWEAYHNILEQTSIIMRQGRVTQVVGLTIEAQGLQAQIGELCYIMPEEAETRRVKQKQIPAEVMGFRDSRTLLMPLDEMHGVGP